MTKEEGHLVADARQYAIMRERTAMDYQELSEMNIKQKELF